VELNPYFKIVVLVWFFGWGLLFFLVAPVRAYRVLSLGRSLSDKQIKYEKWLGIMALVFGVVFVIELLVGVVR
jgi:hypothetical protein